MDRPLFAPDGATEANPKSDSQTGLCLHRLLSAEKRSLQGSRSVGKDFAKLKLPAIDAIDVSGRPANPDFTLRGRELLFAPDSLQTRPRFTPPSGCYRSDAGRKRSRRSRDQQVAGWLRRPTDRSRVNVEHPREAQCGRRLSQRSHSFTDLALILLEPLPGPWILIFWEKALVYFCSQLSLVSESG